MTGDDRSRHCQECQLQVIHLSALKQREAEQVLEQRQGRLCVRIQVDANGRILTAEDLAEPRRRPRSVLARAASWLVLLLGGALASCAEQAGTTGANPPDLDPHAGGGIEARMGDVIELGKVTMGEVVVPPTKLMGALAPPPEPASDAPQEAPKGDR